MLDPLIVLRFDRLGEKKKKKSASDGKYLINQAFALKLKRAIFFSQQWLFVCNAKYSELKDNRIKCSSNLKMDMWIISHIHLLKSSPKTFGKGRLIDKVSYWCVG